MKRSQIIIGVLLVLLLMGAVACSGDMPFSRPGIASSGKYDKEYYQGTNGVMMRFTDMNSPPTRMYYYTDGDRLDNSFNIFVDVHNVGTSYTRGALFVSGYDPSMIDIYDGDGHLLGIPRVGGGWESCAVDFGTSGQGGSFWNSIVGTIGCADSGSSVYRDSPRDWGFNVNEMEPIFDLFNWDAPSIVDNIGLNYNNLGGDNGRLEFNLGDDFNFDYLNRGRGVITMLSGIDFTRFNGQEYILEPDTQYYPGGEQTVEVFEAVIKSWPQGLDKTQTPMPFLVTNCYIYTTMATPQVCIDPQPMRDVPKVCYPREITFNGGNGAPVMVSSIEQENTQREVYFTINLRNSGGGTVYDMGHIERCSPYYPGRVTTQVLDKVYLTDVRIGNTHLDCTPSRWDGVRLVNGHGEVRCKYPLEYLSASSAYETTLSVEIAYGYADYIERRTTIKRGY